MQMMKEEAVHFEENAGTATRLGTREHSVPSQRRLVEVVTVDMSARVATIVTPRDTLNLDAGRRTRIPLLTGSRRRRKLQEAVLK